MLYFIRTIIDFLAGIASIILVSAAPSLFQNGHYFNFMLYIKKLWEVVNELITLFDMVYIEGVDRRKYDIFPMFWDFYEYTAIVFFSSILISFFIALLLAYLTMFLSTKTRSRIKSVVSFLQALPDIFFIFLIQTGVIVLYQKTHILLANVAGGFDRAYTIPILILAILPTLLFFKIMIQIFQEEQEEEYFLFAISKGMERHSVLAVHLLRNALVRVFNHFNSVFWLMISNLGTAE